MKLLTKDQHAQLAANGVARMFGRNPDPFPVVKLFTPDAQCTWLLSELDPNDPDKAFGLCDLGLGCPELGHVSLDQLSAVRGQWGLAVERDKLFEADRPLSAYAEEAGRVGHIVSHHPIPRSRPEPVRDQDRGGRPDGPLRKRRPLFYAGPSRWKG